MTCSVKASCGAGEVAVFRMSGLANAHAGTAGGSAYGSVVCCGGPAGLSTSCAGNYDTALRLWAADNAHVAQASDLTYTNEVCLAAPSMPVDCQYRESCGPGYTCLATISGETNAHVADCDGSDDYATKVCCAAPAPSVGGVAELPDIRGAPSQEAGAPPGESGWSAGAYAALAGAAAVAATAIAAGAWYARRRRLR